MIVQPRADLAGGRRWAFAFRPIIPIGCWRGEQTHVQVLIDGSDSQVATTALNAANLLGVQQSIEHRALNWPRSLQTRPRAMRRARSRCRSRCGRGCSTTRICESAYFFVPGLVGIILQLVTLFLTSFAIVRERELGTLEQLFVTPVGRAGLLLGKLAPYALVGFVETLIVLSVMVYVFGVPIDGSLALLLALSASVPGLRAGAGAADFDAGARRRWRRCSLRSSSCCRRCCCRVHVPAQRRCRCRST